MKRYEEYDNYPEKSLWESYKKEKNQDIRNYFIVKYTPLVKYIAGRVAINIPNYIEFNDLVSYGVIGLIDAIEKYDYTLDIKFKTYAVTRIRGSIFDELRSIDWIPRSVRQKAKEIEKTIADLEMQLGRASKDQEVADAMGLSLSEYHQLLLRVTGNTLISIDEKWRSKEQTDNPISIEDNLRGSEEYNPDIATEKEEIKKLIAKSLIDLPEREKQVLILYYYEQLTLKEIGKILMVTESRVSQLHTKAIIRLKGKLEKIKEHISK